MTIIDVVEGDITTIAVDAIVDAADVLRWAVAGR